MRDTERLMEEVPGGENHGFTSDAYVDDDGAPRVTRRPNDLTLARLDQRGLGAGEGRFGIVTGREDGGLIAHRGILHPDEYVDLTVLRLAAEESLGFTYAEVSAAYKNGRPTAEERQLREKIDARMLVLSRSGGSMKTLADMLDLSEKTVDRALTRARERETAPVVERPAVVTSRVCFKCGEQGAKPRKRRHSKSPTHLTGTIDLCDADYAAGFNSRPGNPAYWEFRDRKAVREEAR